MARRRRAVANGPTRTPGNGGSGAGDQSGLTLVELVVTLLIIGLLAAVSYPSLGNVLAVMISKGSVEQVTGAIRQARQEAITMGQHHCIQFSGTPETTYAIKTASNGSTCDGATPVFSEAIGNGAVVTTPASLTVIFDPTGLVTNYPQPTAACPPVTTGSTKCPFVVQIGVDTQPASCLSTVGVTIYGGVRTTKC